MENRKIIVKQHQMPNRLSPGFRILVEIKFLGTYIIWPYYDWVSQLLITISSPDLSEDEIPIDIFKQQTNYLLNNENNFISSTNDSAI